MFCLIFIKKGKKNSFQRIYLDLCLDNEWLIVFQNNCSSKFKCSLKQVSNYFCFSNKFSFVWQTCSSVYTTKVCGLNKNNKKTWYILIILLFSKDALNCSKYINNITKYFQNQCCSFKILIIKLSWHKINHGFHKNIKQHNCFQHWLNSYFP